MAGRQAVFEIRARQADDCICEQGATPKRLAGLPGTIRWDAEHGKCQHKIFAGLPDANRQDATPSPSLRARRAAATKANAETKAKERCRASVYGAMTSFTVVATRSFTPSVRVFGLGVGDDAVEKDGCGRAEDAVCDSSQQRQGTHDGVVSRVRDFSTDGLSLAPALPASR